MAIGVDDYRGTNITIFAYNRVRYNKHQDTMKKIIGLICFFIAIGMLIMLIINKLLGLLIIALLLFVGYNCFCGD